MVVRRRTIAKVTLSTLLIAGLMVMAVRIGWFVADNAAEKKTIAAIEKLGGRVIRRRVEPDLPRWIAWFWPDSFTFKTLDLGGTQVTDSGFKELAGLESLRELNLSNTNVTDEALKEFAALQSLRELDLRGTRVTDAGLKELAGLKRLKELNLQDTNVTDEGVADLHKFLPRCGIAR